MPAQSWEGYRVERVGSAEIHFVVTRFTERDERGGCVATLSVETYTVDYRRTKEPGREDVVGWGVNPQPSKRDTRTKGDAEGIRVLRNEAAAAQRNLLTRENAERQIDRIVAELTR